MTDDDRLAAARRWFAEDLAAVAPIRTNPAIAEAFATVRREDYLGAGPWGLHSRLAMGEVVESASDDPRHLYHDVLVTIDAASGINNGLPSLWARVFDHLDLKPGDSVVQVGAGLGYFTAVLAELVGAEGRVVAYEIEADLAATAADNLAHLPEVEVHACDATRAADMPAFDALVAAAGVSHVPKIWLEAMAPGGRMVVPLTGADHWGVLMHLASGENGYPVKSIGPCGFYPCEGARRDDEAEAISTALRRSGRGLPDGARYHLGQGADAWVQGEGWWISEPRS